MLPRLSQTTSSSATLAYDSDNDKDRSDPETETDTDTIAPSERASKSQVIPKESREFWQTCDYVQMIFSHYLAVGL